MEDKKNKINLVQQKIIISLLKSNYELLSLAYAKLFTAAKINREWLYSELEGGLTIVVDFNRKSARFIMFDLKTFEILFESELYKNFNTFYNRGNDFFHYFEVGGGFIGFKFVDKSASGVFYESVSNLDKKKIDKYLANQKTISLQELKTKSKRILNLLMLKLSEEYLFKKSDVVDSTIEFNVPQIERQINLFSFDFKNNNFTVNGNSDEIDQLVEKVRSIKSEPKYEKISDVELYTRELVKSVLNSKKYFLKKNSIRLKPEDVKRVQEERKKEEKKQAEQIKIDEKKKAELKKIEDKKIEDEKKSAEKKRLQEEKDSKNKPKDVKKSVIPCVPLVPKVPVPKVPHVPIIPKEDPPMQKAPIIPIVQIVNIIPAENLDIQPTDNNTNPFTTEITPEEIEEINETPKKEIKMDVMSELKMKMQDRENKKKIAEENGEAENISKSIPIYNKSSVTTSKTDFRGNFLLMLRQFEEKKCWRRNNSYYY